MSGDYVFVVVAILACLIATIYDLKVREVPDFLNYFLILFGLGGHLVVSILKWSYLPILYTLIVVGVLWGVSNLLFYSGSWGGGDAKLLVGLGAVLPIFPAKLLEHLTIIQAPWPFIFTLWVNIFIVGAVIGLVATAFLMVKHWKKFAKECTNLNKKYGWVFKAVLASVVVPGVLLFLQHPTAIFALYGWLILVAAFMLTLVGKSVENSVMLVSMAPSELTLGDYVEDVKVKGKILYKRNRAGISEAGLRKLLKLERDKVVKKVKIKEGIPFVPSFLIGLLISLFYGDLMLRFMLSLI